MTKSLWVAAAAAIATACGSSSPTEPSGSGSAGSVALAQFSTTVVTLAGGASVQGTLILDQAAPAGGTDVAVRSSSPRARVPSAVHVDSGASSATFRINTDPLDAPADVTITATGARAARTVLLHLTVGSFITFSSEAGEPIGRGESDGVGIDTAEFTAGVYFQRNALRVQVLRRTPATEFWMLELAAPQGQPLLPGHYEGAVRSVSRTGAQPGMDFSAKGSGCSFLTGSFDVIEADYGGPGTVFDSLTVNRFRARFTQRCTSASQALTGEVRILMNPWR
jgi:hypothetical protein